MNLNPEKNPKVKAILYVIGCGGFLHLTTLLTIAIIKQNFVYFNPLYTIDVDQIWPASRHNPVIYVGGWVVFFGAIYLTYRFLNRSKTEK